MALNNFSFTPSIKPDPLISDKTYIFFYKSRILISSETEIPSFIFEEIPTAISEYKYTEQYVGKINSSNCFVIGLLESPKDNNSVYFQAIRALFGKLPEEQLLIAGRANQIINWAINHRFCGKCSTPTQNKEHELALICPNCETTYYPTISPAIIVAVVKDGKILLGHSKRFKGKFYSVLAGFLEIGETFEECVAREVEEESGVKVKNIKYFGSQPWPFPNSMMIGFTAEWESGEIVLHDEELDDANWYSPHEMPTTPGTFSIAGQLIEWFRKEYS